MLYLPVLCVIPALKFFEVRYKLRAALALFDLSPHLPDCAETAKKNVQTKMFAYPVSKIA